MRVEAKAIQKGIQKQGKPVLWAVCTVVTVTPSLTVSMNGGTVVAQRVPGLTYTIGQTCTALYVPPAPPLIIPSSL